MGVYGNIHGAFNGLGKPSIKLEFEDNESLVAFSKKMQDEEPAPVQWNEEEEMFVPVEGYGDKYIVTDLRQRAKKEPGDVAANKNLKFEKQKDFFIAQVEELIANYDYERKNNNIPTAPGVEELKTHVNNYYLFANKTPQYLFMSVDEYNNNLDKWKKVLVNDVSNIARYVSYYDKIKPKGLNTGLGAPGDTYIDSDGLGKAGDLYLVRDLRTRAKKEPGELAANKNLKFEKQKNDTIKNFNKELYAAPTLANGNKEINGKTYYPVKFGYKYGKNDRYISEMYLFIPKIYNASENKMRGSWRSFDVVIDADKLYNIERNPYSGGFQAYEDEATLRENTNNALRQAFTDVQRNVDYQKEQIEKEKNSPWKSDGMIAKREKYLKEAYKELKYFIMFYANYGKYPAWIMSDNNGGDYPAKMAEDIPEGYIDRSIFAANLAAPGDLGRTANNALYNNLEILDFRGMQPTYRQLPNYDDFFKPAANKNSLKGWGLNDTKKLIADICRNHYKECAAIARHLKADTKLQSAFNLWHWLHHNIRYEYDREGREEVRTPARVWADRHRGVDCDCLSVFAWCVLKCMGYNPAFELAAFRNKPAYSHIYINLDGIVVDRVWFVFNSRPPGVTKTELFKVGMLDNLGQLF